MDESGKNEGPALLIAGAMATEVELDDVAHSSCWVLPFFLSLPTSRKPHVALSTSGDLPRFANWRAEGA